jgi:hypothetical protein
MIVSLDSPKTLSGQTKYEKEWSDKEMQGFSAFKSEAWAVLTQLYGPKISKEEITSLGEIVATELKISLAREYKRRKVTMIEWFQNHLEEIRPFLQNCVQILCENGTVLSGTGTTKPA